MKKSLFTTALLIAGCLSATTGFCDSRKGGKVDAKKEFEKHCAMCHPNGGNTINTKKPLNMKSLKANGIKGTKGIIAKMRHPGPGMTAFDEKTIPNKEAEAIAKYIMKAFK